MNIDELISKAIASLELGDTDCADKAFAAIEQECAPALRKVAKCAYLRGCIDEHRYDWAAALGHYERAVRLEPENKLFKQRLDKLLEMQSK